MRRMLSAPIGFSCEVRRPGRATHWPSVAACQPRSCGTRKRELRMRRASAGSDQRIAALSRRVGAAQDALGGPVFCVPIVRLAGLEREIERLARRAQRLGNAPISLRDTGERAGERALVTLVGEPPRLAGWEVAAIIEHRVGVAALRPTTPAGERLDLGRFAEPRCQHCALRRRRVRTFVLLAASSRELRQVGTSCLRDVLGGHDPELLCRSAEYLSLAREAVSRVDGRPRGPGHRRSRSWPLTRRMSYVRTGGSRPSARAVGRGHERRACPGELASRAGAARRVRQGARRGGASLGAHGPGLQGGAVGFRAQRDRARIWQRGRRRARLRATLRADRRLPPAAGALDASWSTRRDARADRARGARRRQPVTELRDGAALRPARRGRQPAGVVARHAAPRSHRVGSSEYAGGSCATPGSEARRSLCSPIAGPRVRRSTPRAIPQDNRRL